LLQYIHTLFPPSLCLSISPSLSFSLSFYLSLTHSPPPPSPSLPLLVFKNNYRIKPNDKGEREDSNLKKDTPKEFKKQIDFFLVLLVLLLPISRKSAGGENLTYFDNFLLFPPLLVIFELEIIEIIVVQIISLILSLLPHQSPRSCV